MLAEEPWVEFSFRHAGRRERVYSRAEADALIADGVLTDATVITLYCGGAPQQIRADRNPQLPFYVEPEPEPEPELAPQPSPAPQQPSREESVYPLIDPSIDASVERGAAEATESIGAPGSRAGEGAEGLIAVFNATLADGRASPAAFVATIAQFGQVIAVAAMQGDRVVVADDGQAAGHMHAVLFHDRTAGLIPGHDVTASFAGRYHSMAQLPRTVRAAFFTQADGSGLLRIEQLAAVTLRRDSLWLTSRGRLAGFTS